MDTLIHVFSVIFIAVFIVHILTVMAMHVAQFKFEMYSKKVFLKAHFNLLATAIIVTVWFVVIAKEGWV